MLLKYSKNDIYIKVVGNIHFCELQNEIKSTKRELLHF